MTTLAENRSSGLKSFTSSPVFARSFWYRLAKGESTIYARTRFGNASQLTFAAFAYEFANLLSRLELSPNASAQEILAQLASVSEVPSAATGALQFRDTPAHGRFFEAPIVVKRLDEDGTVSIAPPVRAQLR